MSPKPDCQAELQAAHLPRAQSNKVRSWIRFFSRTGSRYCAGTPDVGGYRPCGPVSCASRGSL